MAEIENVLSAPDGKIRQSRDKQILYKRLGGRTDNLIAAVTVEIAPSGLLEVITVLVHFEVKK